MHSHDIIAKADNLWFGENGHKLNRDGAVSLFQTMHHSADDESIGDGQQHQVNRQDNPRDNETKTVNSSHYDYGSLPCANGACCNARRRNNRQDALPTNSPTQNNYKSVCIIGAGPSGLITLKELLTTNNNAAFTNIKCYEASNQIGGAFAVAYEGATMTSSNLLTCFGCYTLSEYELDRKKRSGDDSMDQLFEEEEEEKKDDTGETLSEDHVATMWSTTQYCEYLHAFTDKFQLLPFIHANVEVTLIRKVNDKWEVHTTQSGGSCNTRRTIIETFDAVCVCSGLHQAPNIPSWCCAQPTDEQHLLPEIIHSSQFTREKVTGKHVLVIGLGESGSDIALMSSKVAKSVSISVKDGPSGGSSGYTLPRYTKGEVGDLNTSRGYGAGNVWGPSEYRKFAALVDSASHSSNTAALKELAKCYIGTDKFTPLELMAIEWNDKFNNLPYNRFGTKNYSFLEAIHDYGAKVVGHVSSWDEVPHEVDLIIFCTGYRATFPFFDETSHPAVDLHVSSPNHRNRYLHMIDLDVGTSLAFIGYSRPAFGAIPPLSEMAARYWAMLLTGERTIVPQNARTQIHIDRIYEERLFHRDSARVKSLVQYHRAMDSFSRLIGCLPPLEELKANHPSIFSRVMHSTLSGVQYRLCGEGSREEAWEDILKHQLPRYTRQPKNAFRMKLEAGLFH